MKESGHVEGRGLRSIGLGGGTSEKELLATHPINGRGEAKFNDANASTRLNYASSSEPLFK